MPLSWFFFACLTVIGAVTYNISVRMAGDHINPFMFALVLCVVGAVGHLVCLGIYKYYMPDNAVIHADKTGLWLAVVAGLGVVLIDIGFFYAVKSGGLVSSNMFWFLGSLTLTTIAGYFLFQESLNMTKVIGLVLGLVSVVLIVKS